MTFMPLMTGTDRLSRYSKAGGQQHKTYSMFHPRQWCVHLSLLR